MITITFDWNCVIAVEKNETGGADAVRELVRRHRASEISVALTMVSASENLAGSKTFPASANQFFDRIERLGWSDLQLLPAPATIGLTYWSDETEQSLAYLQDDTGPSQALADEIWNIVAGNTPQGLPADLTEEAFNSKAYRKFRNIWCDVHTLLVHIENNRDIFVTSNTDDFQKHQSAYSPLGLRRVLTPSECVLYLDQSKKRT